jgi:hypothetical protein
MSTLFGGFCSHGGLVAWKLDSRTGLVSSTRITPIAGMLSHLAAAGSGPDEPRRRDPARHRLVLPVRPDRVHAGGAQRVIERGVPPADIQYEVFGPDLWQADLD